MGDYHPYRSPSFDTIKVSVFLRPLEAIPTSLSSAAKKQGTASPKTRCFKKKAFKIFLKGQNFFGAKQNLEQ
jgi:hypothetical protein